MWQDDAHDYLVSNGQSKAVCPLAREDAGDEEWRKAQGGRREPTLPSDPGNALPRDHKQSRVLGDKHFSDLWTDKCQNLPR